MSTIFKIIYRNIKQKFGTTFLNIFSLAIGMTSFVLIMLWVNYETSFESFNTNGARTYRLQTKGIFEGKTTHASQTSKTAVESIAYTFSEVEKYTSILDFGEAQFSQPNGEAFRLRALGTTENFTEVFGVAALLGDINKLSEPNTAFISRKTAKIIYGDDDPIGNFLTTGMDGEMKKFTIVGIFEDIPSNSHLEADFIYSLSSFRWYSSSNDGWFSSNFYNYLVLNENVDAGVFENKLQNYAEEQIDIQLMPSNSSYSEIKAKGNSWEFYLQPLSSIHLHSAGVYELNSNGNILYVYIFLITGFLILIVSILNFTNSFISKVLFNPKETGIRKLSGSSRWEIITQYLTESSVVSFLAFLLAMALVILLYPTFSTFTGISIEKNAWLTVSFAVLLLSIPFVVGILSGIYPALHISNQPTIKILSSNLMKQTNKFSIKEVLIISQFAITIIAIVGALSISRQLDYVQNKNLGFDKENIIVVKGTENLYNGKHDVYKAELLKNPNITSVSYSHGIPSSSPGRRSFALDPENNISMDVMVCDHDFKKVFGLQMAAGTFFTKEFSKKNRKVVINEKAVKEYGLGDCIGTRIKRNNVEYEIIGVVKDFFNQSKKMEIEPTVLIQLPDVDWFWPPSRFALKVKGNRLASSIDYAEKQWKAQLPGFSFTYSFFDEEYGKMYTYESNLKTLFYLFSGIAIFISCFGLFAFVKRVLVNKTKEIGIRKVNGAKVSELLTLLNRDFIKWVAIAFVLACPIAYYAMNKWLSNFAYKTELSWWIFALAGVLAFGIALITVSWQSWKAARRNPIESLRYE